MYQLLVASAQMPASCKGVYKRIAIVETVSAERPKMISERTKGVIRIVRSWERLHVGKTERCAYARAMREAEGLLASLQSGQSEQSA